MVGVGSEDVVEVETIDMHMDLPDHHQTFSSTFKYFGLEWVVELHNFFLSMWIFIFSCVCFELLY
jgi:hypothetical protein